MTETIQNFKIGTKEFVSGLVWDSPLDKSLLSERKKSIKKEYKYICYHKLGKHSIQMGLVPNDDSKVCDVGQLSFAATMAGIIGKPNWVGVFRVTPSQYALIGIRDGYVMAGKDILGDAENIYHTFIELIDTMQDAGEFFEKIYCPKEWDVQGSEFQNIRELINSKQKYAKCPLTGVSGIGISRKNLRNIIAISIIASVSLSGYGIYRFYQKRQDELKEEIVLRTKIIQPPHEWEMMPLVDRQIEFWQEQIDHIPLIFEGWELSGVKITKGKIVFSYVRNEMLSADSFGYKARVFFNGRVAFDKEGKLATITKSFSDLNDVNTQEILLDNKDVNIKFYSWFQDIDTSKMEFNNMQVTLPPVPTSQFNDVINKWGKVNWEKYKWKIDMPPDTEPFIAFNGLDMLSGLRVTSIYCDDIRNSAWHLEGYFYANK